MQAVTINCEFSLPHLTGSEGEKRVSAWFKIKFYNHDRLMLGSAGFLELSSWHWYTFHTLLSPRLPHTHTLWCTHTHTHTHTHTPVLLFCCRYNGHATPKILEPKLEARFYVRLYGLHMFTENPPYCGTIYYKTTTAFSERVVCEECHRKFTRESDKKRCNCTRERLKPVSQQRGVVPCTTHTHIHGTSSNFDASLISEPTFRIILSPHFSSLPDQLEFVFFTIGLP